MIHITVWNENRHEQLYENIRAIYPEGIHGCIAKFLGEEEDFLVKTATFDEPEHGLSENVLQQTDVLIFWNHSLQNEFSDEVAKRVQKHVLRGMGLIALHSSHISKIMKSLLGTSMTLKWRDGDRERLFCTNPSHPIAKGIPEYFDIPQEEMYGEYFDIPKPDDVIFTGWFSSGFVFRSGCTFTRGLGRIFYFQPGHEEYPIYYQKEIQRIIINAVRWCYNENRLKEDLGCPKVEVTPEQIHKEANLSVFHAHIKQASEQSHIEIGTIMKQFAYAGIKAMEVDYFEVKDHEQEFMEYKNAYGLDISCMYASIDLGKNPEDIEAKKVIDLAAKLECKRVLMIPGFLEDKEAVELVSKKESQEETFRFMEENERIQNMKKGLYNKGLKSVATGSGYLPIARLIKTLIVKGYKGYFAIEHFDAPMQFMCAQESAAYLLSLLI